MFGFLNCLVYLSVISFGSFLIGRALPKGLLKFDKVPFKSFAFEKDGDIYVKTGVRKWKSHVPDMSTLCLFSMPSKKLPKLITTEQVEMMLEETCIAEWTHYLLAVLGFGCLFIWESIGGFIVSALYAIGNVPYIIIQRYNRPKFVVLLARLKEKEEIQYENIGKYGGRV